MARQVSGSERTLIEAIRNGEVPRPPLMGWNDFQVWRRDQGKRPSQAVDGYTTETPVETVLWRSVMTDLYGEDWSVRVAAGETGATELNPAASAPQGGLTSVEPSAPAAVEESPESGAGAPIGAAEPGSGVPSPVPSFHSRSPGTPTGLTERTLKAYNPEKENLIAYQERIRRQANALVKLGQPLGAGVLETLLEKSAFQEMIYDLSLIHI